MEIDDLIDDLATPFHSPLSTLHLPISNSMTGLLAQLKSARAVPC